jgi:diguanylate cyclase (GGDEF)-like protein
MMIEIDHFRQFSTSHGHVAGDRALGLAAAVLRESARASDVICRMGGEEFLVISPDTDRAAAMKSAERLRTVVDRRLGAESGAVLPAGGLTLSIGVATRDGSVLGYEALLRLSGEALGMAKLEGRNRVRVASTPVTPLPSGIPASA